MAFYGKVLQDLIEGEKQGKHYRYSPADRLVLDEMFLEINRQAGTGFQYLAELDAFTVPGSGPIIARYIRKLETASARAFLIPQMVADRIPDCDRLVLELYRDFRQSPDRPAAAYVRYDNAFRSLKPKRLKAELLALVENPLDAYWLPFTMKTLASWKLSGLYPILLRYADSDSTAPELAAQIRRELKFRAIAGLKYYPTAETAQILLSFTQSPDQDLVQAARKSLKTPEKSRMKGETP
jgi:hypothetical protein